MLKVFHSSRDHRHDDAGCLEFVRADPDCIVSVLARKRRIHDRGLGTETLRLRAFRLDTVAFAHIDEHRDNEQHIVLIIISRRIVRFRGHMDLHESGSSGELLCIRRDSV